MQHADGNSTGPSAASHKYAPNSEAEELALLLVLQLQMIERDIKGDIKGDANKTDIAEPDRSTVTSTTTNDAYATRRTVAESALMLTNVAWLLLPRLVELFATKFIKVKSCNLLSTAMAGLLLYFSLSCVAGGSLKRQPHLALSVCPWQLEPENIKLCFATLCTCTIDGLLLC